MRALESIAARVRAAFGAEYVDAGGALLLKRQRHDVLALAFGLIPGAMRGRPWRGWRA